MADLSTLAGTTFSPADYAEQVNVTFNGDGTVTAAAFGPGLFSNADTAAGTGQDAIAGMVTSVNTTASTPFGLGTVTINDVDTVTSKVVGTYTADVIGTNANGQVLLGIEPYTGSTADPYNGSYALLSSTSLSQDPNATTTYSTNLSYPGSFDLPCFATGTMIATPGGEVAVETIRAGDLVTTLSGDARRVIWVGSRRVDLARHPRPDTVRPVRIAAGAFDENVPSRDLILSPDHAVHAAGVLIPSKLLVNGTTVAVLDQPSVTYHHVELEHHDVLLANGLLTPAEAVARYDAVGERVREAAEQALSSRPLASAAEAAK